MVLAPCEVVQHISWLDAMICAAVLRDHSKREVVTAGHWQERTASPPAWRRGATPLAQRSAPQARTTDHSDRDLHDASDLDPLPHTRGSLGRPSTISPMMLRCTCDEPA